MKRYISTKHILITSFLFITEIAIAYFHFNPFIRGFLGDVLVMLLLYSFLKIFIKNNVFNIAISVLGFAFLVELLQFLKLSEILKIKSKIILTVLGSVFDVWDLVAYFIGFLLILLIEKLLHKKYTSVFF
jgi:hypothetical protein